MGRSKSSCLKILTCAHGDNDDPVASLESKVSSDKRRWNFRKRSPAHQVQGNTLISEPVCVSNNVENSELNKNNLHSPKRSSVLEKALIKETPSEIPQESSVTVKSELVTPQVPEISDVGDNNIHESTVVIIQAYIRGYLVRKELPKLRNVIKMQAAVRGHLVRRQAVGTLRCAQAIIKIQALIRARRARISSKKLYIDEDEKKFKMDLENPVTLEEADSSMKLDIKWNSTKSLLSNGFARQLLESTPRTKPIYIDCDPSKSDSAWKWLERWMAVITSEGQEQEQSFRGYEGQEGRSKPLDFEAENDENFAMLSVSSNLKLVPSESTVHTETAMHLRKKSCSFDFYDTLSTLEKCSSMNDDQEKFPTENKAINMKQEKHIEVNTDTASALAHETVSDKPGSDSNLESHNTKILNVTLENEGKKFVVEAMVDNLVLVFSDAQTMFEDQVPISMGGTIDPTQHATAISRLDDSHFQVDSSAKTKEHNLPENSFSHDSRIQDAASECGTEISISSTLDSPDRSEAEDGEIIIELGSMENQKYVNSNLSDVSFNPGSTEAGNVPYHKEVLLSERHGEYGQNISKSMTASDSVQEEKQSEELTTSIMQSQVENSVILQNHTSSSELQGTPSSQTSVKSGKNKKESRKSDGKLISNIGKKSPSNSAKDSKNAKGRHSLGIAIPDNIDREARFSTSSSLPSYMQATESARAKAHASISPKSSPDLHNKDNQIKKRHTLPLAIGKQSSSPRIQRSTSQVHQSPKDKGINSPHNSAGRRWQK